MAIEVAAGVLLNAQGHVLLAQRPQGKVYAGWWEVPGGKFEPGEDAHHALVRELHEELGLRIDHSSAWYVHEHHYPHGHVRLHFRRLWQWIGEPRALESQVFAWFDPQKQDPSTVSPILPATEPLLAWLSLPAMLTVDDPRAQVLESIEVDGLSDPFVQIESVSAKVSRPCYLKHGELLADINRLSAQGRISGLASGLASELDQLSSSLGKGSPATR